MTLLLVYMALALGFSFLCSIMEAVLLSVSPSFVARQEQEGLRLGTRLRKFKDNVDQPLAAILSLNTIAHTVGAAGAGAQAAAVFGDAYIGLISAVLTFLILVFSEIIPKTLGAAYWRRLTPSVVRLLEVTIWIMYPLVKLADTLTRWLTKGRERSKVHRDEFIALAQLGAREGVFHKYESRILNNLFCFREVRTSDIMTPRTVLFALSENLSVDETLSLHSHLPFSRIPVYGENLDQITGFVLKNEILRAGQEKKGAALLSEMRRPLVVIPEALPLHRLFERLMDEKAHIALAVDEYGGTQGVVTMEDFIETLLGLEIVDEIDTVEDMQAMAREQWRKRALKLGLIDGANI
ncbi:MAG: hemolysin family protein [Desulfobacteraceae bacterium]